MREELLLHLPQLHAPDGVAANRIVVYEQRVVETGCVHGLNKVPYPIWLDGDFSCDFVNALAGRQARILDSERILWTRRRVFGTVSDR